jgi:hypothetical protein
VTYSGATTANVLAEPQHGAPPQVAALDGSEELVTVTIGGNDAGYVPLLFAAGLPRLARSPRAKVLFVDYLTLLPAVGAAPPLSGVDVALGRRPHRRRGGPRRQSVVSRT